MTIVEFECEDCGKEIDGHRQWRFCPLCKGDLRRLDPEPDIDPDDGPEPFEGARADRVADGYVNDCMARGEPR